MTTKKHMQITQTSKATATRDLKLLASIREFIVGGSSRNTHYYLNMDN
jgi:hypothetical protein